MVTEEGLMPAKQHSIPSSELGGSLPKVKNPESLSRNSSNLTKYLVLRELTRLDGHGGVPSSALAKRLGLNLTNVETRLKHYAEFELVTRLGKIKRREGGRPFYLWGITTLGKERLNYFESKIQRGQDVGYRH